MLGSIYFPEPTVRKYVPCSKRTISSSSILPNMFLLLFSSQYKTKRQGREWDEARRGRGVLWVWLTEMAVESLVSTVRNEDLCDWKTIRRTLKRLPYMEEWSLTRLGVSCAQPQELGTNAWGFGFSPQPTEVISVFTVSYSTGCQPDNTSFFCHLFVHNLKHRLSVVWGFKWFPRCN